MKRLLLLSVMLLVGCAISYAQEKMEINGALILGNSDNPSPASGTIRFNPSTNDFEGWNGQWVSLTSASGAVGSGMITDIDGNQYLTVTIGNQTWMRENLRTTRYRNGDPIPEVVLNSNWTSLNSGAWCWHDHDPEKDIPYGKLYNWYAVADTRGLCPTGWHVPTTVDWETLTTLLGGLAGGKMKKTGTIQAFTGDWQDPNTGATNESGFSGLPSGNRIASTGVFNNFGLNGFFWSSSEAGSSNGWFLSLNFSSSSANANFSNKRSGFSVRCVQD